MVSRNFMAPKLPRNHIITGSTDAQRRGKIKGDAKRGIDTNFIYKTDRFLAPIEQLKRSGEYKIKANQTVYLCFRSDFFIEEADQWREECWQMIKTRYHRIDQLLELYHPKL